MNYDYEIEKRYHPENFLPQTILDDDIPDFEHDNFETEGGENDDN